jgi:hypothetical protein
MGIDSVRPPRHKAADPPEEQRDIVPPAYGRTPSLAIKNLLPRKQCRSQAIVRARSRILIQVWGAAL